MYQKSLQLINFVLKLQVKQQQKIYFHAKVSMSLLCSYFQKQDIHSVCLLISGFGCKLHLCPQHRNSKEILTTNS